MKLMKRILIGGLACSFAVTAVSCSNEVETITKSNSFFKEFNRVGNYDSTLPQNYQFTDYKLLAELFDEIAFDFNAQGNYLPLIWDDITYESFGIPAYVGDGRVGQDGHQEAVTSIAAVLSATLNGIDKSNQDGKDYVTMLNAFFSEEEGIVLNNPSGSSATTSMWYLIYPAILYTQVSIMYEDHEQMRQNTLKNIENWYKAYEIMRDLEPSDFDFTGFDFTTWSPYRNDIWREPDCTVGLAILFYNGYILTGNEDYLTAVITLMDYIDAYFGGPLYEVLMYYAPALAAQLNALHGTNYDITKSLNRVFDGNSIPRGGWGSISGTWGDYGMDGLFGSTTDGGGYAFAMNTFAAAGAVAPLVRYDSRYAASVGKWILHLNSNSRYFFAGETKEENQSVTYFPELPTVPESILKAVPYEGIRKSSNGRSPWFGGDPTVYGWAETDFSLYSGAHIGVLGVLSEETEQNGILKTNLLPTNPIQTEAFPTYLIYNPLEESHQITYYTSTTGAVDLFDTVTNTVLASNVESETKLTIEADSAVVIVEIPTGKAIEQEGLNYFVDGNYISSDQSTIYLEGLENNNRVSGKFDLKLGLASNFDDEIESAVLTIDEQTFEFKNKLTLNTKDFTKSARQLHIKAITKNGLVDEVNIRLIFE